MINSVVSAVVQGFNRDGVATSNVATSDMNLFEGGSRNFEEVFTSKTFVANAQAELDVSELDISQLQSALEGKVSIDQDLSSAIESRLQRGDTIQDIVEWVSGAVDTPLNNEQRIALIGALRTVISTSGAPANVTASEGIAPAVLPTSTSRYEALKNYGERIESVNTKVPTAALTEVVKAIPGASREAVTENSVNQMLRMLTVSNEIPTKLEVRTQSDNTVAQVAVRDGVQVFKASVSTQVDSRNPNAFADRLVHILADKVQLQVSSKGQNATIRLDPPELGRMELNVRVDGDRLNVNVGAQNVQVRDALHQTIERLREDLLASGFASVDVNVSSDERGSESSDTEYMSETIISSSEIDDEVTDGSDHDTLAIV
ncbi:flagellar hook-length control protein FliK [Vibrio breoganii]